MTKIFTHIYALTILSSIYCLDLEPIDIIKKSANRLNDINLEFNVNIKQQTLVNKPINFNLDFKVYWPFEDSLFFYNHTKFNSPLDYKDIELWLNYNKDTTLVRKKLPIDNEISDVDSNSDNVNIINFFNLIDLLDEIDNQSFTLKSTNFNNREVYYIKVFSKKQKKKSTKIYIDKQNFNLYKIEWSDRRGRIIRKIIFDDWIIKNDIDFFSTVLFEDFKDESKITCKLSEIDFDKIDDNDINVIKSGF